MTQSICSFPGCPDPVIARGWCVKHYERWRRHGDPGVTLRLRGVPVTERFWSKVNKDGPTPKHRPDLGPCWQWAGTIVNGYGSLDVNKQAVRAHCFAYELLVGPIPDGLELDHLCQNKRCVNPVHLEAVTHRENTMRAVSFVSENAAKTHCPRGHPYDEANTYIRPGGRDRQCRACKRTGGLTAPAINAAKTHCPKGHPYDEANTYRLPSGSRACRACHRERSRTWQARRKAR